MWSYHPNFRCASHSYVLVITLYHTVNVNNILTNGTIIDYLLWEVSRTTESKSMGGEMM